MLIANLIYYNIFDDKVLVNLLKLYKSYKDLIKTPNINSMYRLDFQYYTLNLVNQGIINYFKYLLEIIDIYIFYCIIM